MLEGRLSWCLINISSEGSGQHALFISQILACSGSLVCCVPAGGPSGSPTADPRSVLHLEPVAGLEMVTGHKT